MTQIKDYPNRITPLADDFLYLITNGNTDYKILINSVLGRLIKSTAEQNYSIIAPDVYHTIRLEFSASTIVTVPLEATSQFNVGDVIKIRNTSITDNAVLLPETIAVSINTKSGLNIIPNGEIELVYIGGDVWDVSGDLV